MANLVWAVESVLLGLWGFILSAAYSTPFNQFISLSQLVIACITLFFHAVVASRAPTRAFAVSQAYACAVAAIGLMYCIVLTDADSYDRAFGTATLLGSMPLAAEIGLAWIVLLTFSAVGMCIQDVNDNQKTALMLHPFGYHMIVALPCLIIISTRNSGLTTAMLFTFWALYLVLEFTARAFYSASAYRDAVLSDSDRKFFVKRTWHSLTYPIRRLQTFDDMRAEDIVSFSADMAGKGVFLIISIVAYFSAVGSQGVVCLVLIAVAALQQLGWLDFVDWILGDYEEDPVRLGRGWGISSDESTTATTSAGDNTGPSAPPKGEVLAAEATTNGAGVRFRQPDLHIPIQWRDKAV
jgi:hypothetical protein